MKKIVLFLILILALANSFSMYAQDTLRADKIGIYSNKQKVINRDIDLKGGVLSIPDGVVLNFKGGLIKNGTIIGNNTQIICKKQAFDNITIKGVWNIPTIYSTWFKDLTKVNSLKNVMALTNPAIKNKVIIDEGEYWVSVERNAQVCLPISSQTDLILNGTIQLLPNSFTNYYILNLQGSDISVAGSGTIVGDKYSHTGLKGEWGMGINVRRGKNLLIKDITIKECWGDCIYVGTSSENVKITNCTLIDGRRQGISVTSANGVYISNCKISKVRGTAPQYAIDIEPNEGDTVDNVVIKNVEAFDCYGGILTYGRAKNAQISSVILDNCKVYDCEAKYPVNFQKGKFVSVKKCNVDARERTAILFQDINAVHATGNRLKTNNKYPIRTLYCKEQSISNNIIMK